jgi:hypothetical protein
MKQRVLGAATVVFGMFLQPVLANESASAQPVSPKPLICIGLPDLRLAGSTPAPAPAALRDLISQQMANAGISTKSLQTTLTDQALLEAQQSGCGSILFVTANQVRPAVKSGFFRRALAQAGTSAAVSMPGGSSAGSAIARSVAVNGVYSAAELFTAVKANDQIHLDFHLDSAADHTPLTSGQVSAKAKSDGEDVFTPLAARIVNTILPVAKKAAGNLDQR